MEILLLDMTSGNIISIILIIVGIIIGLWLIVVTRGLIIIIPLLIWGGIALYQNYTEGQTKCLSGDCVDGFGKKRYVRSDGVEIYEGYFKGGAKHGKGKSTNPETGKVIEGYWDFGDYEGKSVEKSSNSSSSTKSNTTRRRNPCDNFNYDVISNKLERNYGNAASYAIYIQCKNNGAYEYIFKYQDFNNGHIEYTKNGSGYKFGNEYKAAKSACRCE